MLVKEKLESIWFTLCANSNKQSKSLCLCAVSFWWLMWFSRHKARGVSTWNHLDIRILLVKLFCQALWDSQLTKQPKKFKLFLTFTSGLFLIVSVGISGLGLLSYHLSVRTVCFSHNFLLLATYF